jgi:hypothetical protein
MVCIITIADEDREIFLDKLRILVDLSGGDILAMKECQKNYNLTRQLNERAIFFENFIEVGDKLQTKVKGVEATNLGIGDFSKFGDDNKTSLKILISSPNIEVLRLNIRKLKDNIPKMFFNLISTSVFEGVVDFLIFFRSNFFEHFHIPRLKSIFQSDETNKDSKATHPIDRRKEQQRNCQFRVLVLPPFIVSNKLNCLIKLLVKQAGLLLVDSKIVNYNDQLDFMFHGFEENQILHDILIKNFRGGQTELVLYKTFTDHENFIEELFESIFDIPSDISFSSVFAIQKLGAGFLDQFSFRGKQTYKHTDKVNSPKSVCKLIGLASFLKEKYCGDQVVSQSALTIQSSYLEYSCLLLMYKYFGLAFMNFEWNEDFNKIFEMRNESVYVMIKPASEHCIANCLKMLKWLE